MNCSFCNNTFSGKSALKKHQKTAKYCLKIQGVKGKIYKCEFCSKKYTQKIDLQRHELICAEKKVKQVNNSTNKKLSEKDRLIAKLESQIRELQDKLVSIAEKAVSKPMIQDNRIQQINNFAPITDEHLLEHVDNLTLDHIKNGASGYAQYALEYPLKDRVLCTDYSRRKLRYKNGDGQIVSDPEMITLTKKLFSAIQERNTVLIKEYAREFQLKFLGLSSEFSDEMDEKEQEEFDQRSTEIHEFLTQITTQDRQVKELANGYRSELFHEFIRHVCSASV